MVPVDPRSPVLVGAGQLTWTDRTTPTSPLELMTEAARRALQDTGSAARLLPRIGSVAVVDCLSWNAPDPGHALAAELGAEPAETVTTHASGTSPLDILRDAAGRIRAGELDVALIAGAEAVKSTSDGRYTGGPDQPEGTTPTRTLGTGRHATQDAEEAAGLLSPVRVYPLFENAIRAESGHDIAAHDEWLGALWSRFGAVATSNPHAWLSTAPSAQSIVESGHGNRMITFPYRKLLTANIFVDQSAALVLCSAGAAEAAGIPRENWVFVHSAAAANDHWYVGERAELSHSPAIAAVGRAALGHAEAHIDEITHLDLYSCFPSAVQIAARELGVDLRDGKREPTVTGGLTFAGGPGSNYVTHALATLVARLRADPGSLGMCTGVGWYLTKHAAAVLSTSPPPRPFAGIDVQSEVDAQPRRRIAETTDGTATIETYTVAFAPDNEPGSGHISCLLPDGSRAFAGTDDPGTIAGLLDTDPLGARVHLRPGAQFTFP